jgi:hypothetical protein
MQWFKIQQSMLPTQTSSIITAILLFLVLRLFFLPPVIISRLLLVIVPVIPTPALVVIVSAFSFLVLPVVIVVVAIVVVVVLLVVWLLAFVAVVFISVLRLLLHGLAHCVPKIVLVVLFGLAKVFLLKQDLLDVLSPKPLVGNFLIMWNEILVSLVTQILHVLKSDGLVFIVDRTQEALELVTALELDANLVAEKVLDCWQAHSLLVDLNIIYPVFIYYLLLWSTLIMLH